ncbi:MAG: polysaccharide biosynthesis/export family protein [Hymenobacter sp.]
MPYLQGTSYSTTQPTEVQNARPVYLLQAGDVLSIKVQSVQPALSDIFNVQGPQVITSGDPGVLYLTGYSVDDTGTITLPTIGKLKVTGLERGSRPNAGARQSGRVRAQRQRAGQAAELQDNGAGRGAPAGPLLRL